MEEKEGSKGTPKGFTLWKNRVTVGKKRQEDEKAEGDKYEKAYLGEILPEENSDFGSHQTVVNLAYVDVRSSAANLHAKNPKIFISPEDEEADLFAEVMEKVINTQYSKVWKMDEITRNAIKTTKIRGRSFFQVTYKFDKDKIGRPYCGGEPNDEIVIYHVSREKMIIPKGATDPNSAPWVAKEVTAPISKIRKKFNLRPTDKLNVIEAKGLPEGMSSEDREDFQSGTYWEIENRIDTTLAVIVDGVDRWAVKPYKHPYDVYSMYVPLEWNDLPNRLDTKSDFYFWFGLLQNLAETKSQQLNHRRKLNTKVIFRSQDAPTDRQLKALKSYNDGEVVHLKPQQNIEPWQPTNTPGDIYRDEVSTRQDIGIVSGMGEQKQGVSSKDKTAREALLIAKEATTVTADRVATIEKSVTRVVEIIIWMIQEFYTKTRIIALSGMEEAEFLEFKDRLNEGKGKGQEIVLGDHNRPRVRFVGSKMKGKYNVRIEPGSMLPDDEAARQQSLQLLFALIQSYPEIKNFLDPPELAKEIAKNLRLDIKGILTEPKNPDQENLLLKRGIFVLPKWNENHLEHIQKHESGGGETEENRAHIKSHRLMAKIMGQIQTGQPLSIPGLPGVGIQDLLNQLPGGLPTGPLNSGPGASLGQNPNQGAPAAPAAQAPQAGQGGGPVLPI